MCTVASGDVLVTVAAADVGESTASADVVNSWRRQMFSIYYYSFDLLH